MSGHLIFLGLLANDAHFYISFIREGPLSKNGVSTYFSVMPRQIT